MGIVEYEQMRAKLEILKMLEEDEKDVGYGRITPIEETFEEIRRALVEQNKKHYTHNT